jgi:hypothetical protein
VAAAAGHPRLSAVQAGYIGLRDEHELALGSGALQQFVRAAGVAARKALGNDRVDAPSPQEIAEYAEVLAEPVGVSRFAADGTGAPRRRVAELLHLYFMTCRRGDRAPQVQVAITDMYHSITARRSRWPCDMVE